MHMQIHMHFHNAIRFKGCTFTDLVVRARDVQTGTLTHMSPEKQLQPYTMQGLN